MNEGAPLLAAPSAAAVSHQNHHETGPALGAAALLIRDALLGADAMLDHPSQGAYDPYQHEEEEDDDKKVQKAGWTAAVHDHLQVGRQYGALHCQRWCASRVWVRLGYAVAWILVVLSLIEPPYWCRSLVRDAQDPLGACGTLLSQQGPPAGQDVDLNNNITSSLYHNVHDHRYDYYPNSKSMLLTLSQAWWIQNACLMHMTVFLLLRLGRDGGSLWCFLRPGPSRYLRMLQLVSYAGLALATWGSSSSFLAGLSPFQPYFRLVWLMTILLGPLREIRVLMKLVPQVLNILILLGVFMLFYAWFGTVMFVGTDQGRHHFANLRDSLWTLWICVTTANYPDVMMDAYNGNRWVALYFISFMILSFFFLMNVILASVVNEYDTAVQQRQQERQDRTEAALRKAYAGLDPQQIGRISRDTVMDLFGILNRDFPEFRHLSDADTKLLFAILDKDGTSTITPEEFMDFGNVLLLEFIKASDYATALEIHCPSWFHSVRYQRFAALVQSDMFEYGLDGILVLNAVVIGIQSYPELSGQAVEIDPKYWDGSIDTVWELMETIFTGIYCLEVVTKVVVLGWRKYLESHKNVFDFTITVMAVVSSAVVYYPNQFSDSRLIRMIVMARVLRLVRLLTAMKRFQLIGRISTEILPAATNVILVLFYILYFFAALGVHLYGGMITRDPNNRLAYLILDTDFSDNNYWANNFNDMISAMNVLFNLLVINNWTECEVGFEAVTEAKWVRWYFLSFHILGVVLVNNLVVAFIINSFLQQLAILRESTNEVVVVDGQAVIQDRHAVFDATEVTGTKTFLTGQYIARLRKTDSFDIRQGHDQERLRLLFTSQHSSGSERFTGTPPSGLRIAAANQPKG